MNRQKIGISLFWLGVACMVVMQALTWFQVPMQRDHTAEELRGTVYAVDGALWWIRNMGGSGLALSFVGVLLYTGRKGSWLWLLGFLPNVLLVSGMYWQPSRYLPLLFGLGGTVMLLSYFGILWFWTRTYGAYEGLARTGRQVQLLGYSLLVATGFLLCMVFGDPKQLALAEYPIPSALSVNLTLSLGMLLLFMGHYLVARGSTQAAANP